MHQPQALNLGGNTSLAMQGGHLVLRSRVVVTGLYDPAPTVRLLAKHDALTYPYRCTFGGAQLVIHKDVFCPTLTNASPLLLGAVEVRSGERVLDVFSGSGVFGIIAALKGAASVVTVDNSSLAVVCTKENVLLNGVDGQIAVREGTMQECVSADETFELIIANPPLLPGRPADPLSSALFDPDLQATLDLIAALPTHLAEGGRCYLTTSDVFGRYGYDLDRICAEAGLLASIATIADVGYESYRVHRITRLTESLRAVDSTVAP